MRDRQIFKLFLVLSLLTLVFVIMVQFLMKGPQSQDLIREPQQVESSKE